MTRPRAATSQPLRARRAIFTAITLLIPVVVVLLLELILRAVNYGGTLSLVIRQSRGGKEMHVINRSFARRYFVQSGTVIPEPADDAFEVVKPPGTKRIFCLGESTMAGFPYDFNATAPSLLCDLLQERLPGVRVEIINVGLSAVGSTIIRDFLGEILDCDPDLLIFYVGHNEFYGAYGVGSTVSGGGSWLTRLSLFALRFKTYLFLRDIYGTITRGLTPEPKKGDTTLMAQVVGDRQIPYGSDLYLRAREIYRGNLEAIIRACRSRPVPVLFSTLICNLKDQAPFVSLSDPAARTEWSQLIARGDSLSRAGQWTPALLAYRTAVRTDSMDADGWFALGKAALALHDSLSSSEAFSRARDLDALRFRITSEFQQVLITACRLNGVAVARVDSAFNRASPGGITGHELILEHLHPNIRGYLLMARTWCNAIKENRLLGDTLSWGPEPAISDNEQLHRSAVTEFDSLVGAIKVQILTHAWPFTNSPTSYSFKPSSPLESIVYDYVRGVRFWSDARYAVAEACARAGHFEQAREECLAVAKVASYSYEPLLRVADYYDAEGLTKQAMQAYRASYERQENPFARLKLAILLLQEENPRDAITQVERALELDRTGKANLKPEATAGARYLLGAAYAKLGDLPRARQELQRALLIRPDDPDARDLLNQLDRQTQP